MKGKDSNAPGDPWKSSKAIGEKGIKEMIAESNGERLHATPHTVGRFTYVLLLGCAVSALTPSAYALPSYARQTGQRCAACHVGGNFPQLTPWGRFFKLVGYSAGKTFIDREGFEYSPVGVIGKAGLTWAAQPKNSQGQTVIEHNGVPEFYDGFGELGTKFTNWSGIYLEYGVNNTFPGWKGVEGPVDIRATHVFHPGNHELLAGFDTNNAPTIQDVWNTVPAWSYPFFYLGSPQTPSAPGRLMITNLAIATGSVGAYVLFDRHIYAEVSMYRVVNDFSAS
jgi:hypothetical protein